jgi:hypothetical protein
MTDNYVSDPTCKRLGGHTFLACAILATELMIIMKHGFHMFTDAMTEHKKMMLFVAGGVYCVVCFFVCKRIAKSKQA